MTSPRREHSNRRIPVRLPTGGADPYLMGFFKVTNDVAVSMYQNPLMPVRWRVYLAVVLACVQDAKHPALLEAHENLAELAVGHLAAATGLKERSVRRALAELEADGCIVWNKGDARSKPTFSLVLRPVARSLPGHPGVRVTRSPGGPPTRSPFVFKSVSDSGVKKERRKKEPTITPSEDNEKLSEDHESGNQTESVSDEGPTDVRRRTDEEIVRLAALMDPDEVRAGWEQVLSRLSSSVDHKALRYLRAGEPMVFGDQLTVSFNYSSWMNIAARGMPEVLREVRVWLGPRALLALVEVPMYARQREAAQ